jgi:hypothetical protein
MTDKPTSQPLAEAPVPNQSHSDRAGTDLAQQLNRIHEHRSASHQVPQLLTSVLRGVNADLLDVEACLAHTLRQELLEGEQSIESFVQSYPAIDTLIRLARQIAQLAQLEMRYTPVESGTSKQKPR